MYPFIALRLTYPLGDLAMGTSLMRYYRWLQKTQWWSSEQLRELQDRKLRALVGHAYDKVPYYRKLFNELGLAVRDIRTIDDLAKLPILTKADIRQNAEAMTADNLAKWRPLHGHTGGSTGEPLHYYITKDTASINWAGMFRGWGWADYRLGDRRISLGGSAMVAPGPMDIMKRARLLVERNLPITTLGVDEHRLEQIVDRFRHYRPKYVYGYSSAIYLVAEYMIEHHLDDVQLRAVFATSEMLLPHYRMKIEQAFHCEVFDCYGSYDGGAQALECSSHQGYHMSLEKAVMEFVDEDGKAVPPGQVGEIVVTDLNNYAMPFIRYSVGDLGVPAGEACGCGRGLPLMRSIEGRSLDFVVLPNGGKVRGLDLIDVFYEHPDSGTPPELATVKRFQIVQDEPDYLLIRVAQMARATPEEVTWIKAGLTKALGYPMDMRVEFVDEIKDSPNGKRNYIMSNRRLHPANRGTGHGPAAI